MANVVELKDSNNTACYPLTKAQAVYFDDGGTVNILSRGLARNYNDVKLIDGRKWYKGDITFAQGSVTSSGESASNVDIRTGYLEGELYIFNPGQFYEYSILEYDSGKAFKGYVAGTSTLHSGFYNDELLHIPPVHGGYHRVRVRRYENGTTVNINPNTIIPFSIYVPETQPLLALGTLQTSGGYVYSSIVTVSDHISLDNHQGIVVRNVNNQAKLAIYYTDNNGSSYYLYTGGFLTGTVAEFRYSPERPNRKYVIRAEALSGVTFNYKTVTDSVSLEYIDTVTGYKRDYSDITCSLTFENKKIETTAGITDSNVDLLAELPSSGSVEVKMNTPAGKFAIYRVTNGTTIQMQDFTHYQYYYTGDYTSKYYVRVKKEDNTSINVVSGPSIVRVYTYVDRGHEYNRVTRLSGYDIAFFGDSIVQGRMPKNSSSVNICMAKPFGVLISEVIGDTSPMIYGIGGATVYDLDWKSLYRNVGLVTGHDIVFVCAGTNDYGSNVSSANFTSAFEYVIQQLKANNDRVIVCTPTFRINGDTANTENLTLGDYVNIEKTVAAEQNVSVIDVYGRTFQNFYFMETLKDNLHPNEMGQQVIASIILEEFEYL